MNKKESLCHNASEALQLIRDLCVGYDGFNTVEGLKSLIDDVRGIAEDALIKKERKPKERNDCENL